MQTYRCTRNALYQHECLGHDDITARQGYYIHAESEEEAWQRMAIRYPDEAELGFTIQKWDSGSVVVVKIF